LSEVELLVTVKLFATLINHKSGTQPGVPFEVEIPDGSALSDLIIQLRLPEKEVKLTFVNGCLREHNYKLNNNDDVGIFPPIGGG
jgi:molybdopterin synthase sulfur carrier subunit